MNTSFALVEIPSSATVFEHFKSRRAPPLGGTSSPATAKISGSVGPDSNGHRQIDGDSSARMPRPRATDGILSRTSLLLTLDLWDHGSVEFSAEALVGPRLSA